MKINYIITSYAGKYYKYNNYPYRDYFLRYNLCLLNKIKSNIDQITIMKPKINKDHIEINNYYNFDNLDIENIRHKIKIYECENIGISYGQFFNAIKKSMDFDYYIFTEDDYIPFTDYFEQHLIDEYTKINKTTFLCLYYFKNKKYNLDLFKDNKIVMNEFRNNNDISYHVPDFSIGIFSSKCVNILIDKYNSIDNIINIFDNNTNINVIYLHQVLFGLILNNANITIHDISSLYLNLFYNSTTNSIQILSDDNNNKLLPLFIPIDLFYINNYDLLEILNKYLININEFHIKFEEFNLIKKLN